MIVWKLLTIANLLRNSLPTSFSVVNTYTADGDVYFHYGRSNKFAHRLFRFELLTKKLRVLDLPKEISMSNS